MIFILYLQFNSIFGMPAFKKKTGLCEKRAKNCKIAKKKKKFGVRIACTPPPALVEACKKLSEVPTCGVRKFDFHSMSATQPALLVLVLLKYVDVVSALYLENFNKKLSTIYQFDGFLGVKNIEDRYKDLPETSKYGRCIGTNLFELCKGPDLPAEFNEMLTYYCASNEPFHKLLKFWFCAVDGLQNILYTYWSTKYFVPKKKSFSKALVYAQQKETIYFAGKEFPIDHTKQFTSLPIDCVIVVGEDWFFENCQYNCSCSNDSWHHVHYDYEMSKKGDDKTPKNIITCLGETPLATKIIKDYLIISRSNFREDAKTWDYYPEVFRESLGVDISQIVYQMLSD